jgi:hypothetical protein
VFRMGPHSDSGIFSGPTNTGTPKSTTIHVRTPYTPICFLTSSPLQEERISLRNLSPQTTTS